MKTAAALMVALVALATLAAAADPTPFAVSPPAVIVDFDSHTVQGEPIQLDWSGTPGVFYLQTAEGSQPKVTIRHYTITLGDKAPVNVKAEPAWASQDWAFKSRRDAPAEKDLLIAVQTRTEDNRIPTQSLSDQAKSMQSGGGEFALRGAEEAANDRKNAANVRSLTLKGTVIGEFFNGPLIPGLTFGWSPETLHAVAFADPKGHLALFDYVLNATQTVDGTANVLLPAWSMDGLKIVFLQRTGKKRYTLEQVNVTRP